MLDVKEVYGLDHYSFININEYLKQILTEVKNDYSKKLQIISKGIKGERNVESHLLNLKETNEIDFWNGVYLEVENNTFETDFLLFSNKGLFSIEVKNIGGGNSYDLHVSSDGQWRKVYKNGKEEVIQDIVSQSNYHITLTQKLINKYKRETGIEIPLVEPIFAIGNDDVKLENDSTLLIFRGSYIVHYIRKQSVIINDDVINDFKKWLEQFVVPERTYPIKDYSFLLNNIANFLKTNDTDLTYYENKVEGISNDIIHNQYKKIPKDLKKEFNLK
nr:nuclease-related domain-containing protein [Alkalibacillus almallahensis]